MDKIQKAAYATLVFFEIFHRPATSQEVRRYLYGAPASAAEMDEALNKLVRLGLIINVGDWYGLPGTAGQIRQMPDRLLYSERLASKAQRWTRVFKMVPFVRAVLITNSVAMRNADADSDIDLVVVADKNIYTAKSFIWLLLKLFGQYESKSGKAGKFSLGYLFSTDDLDLSHDNFLHPEPIAYFWTALYRPLFSSGGYEQLLGKNVWVKDKLPNFVPEPSDDTSSSRVQKVLERIFDAIFGRWLERKLAAMHIKHTWSLPENHWQTAYTIATPVRLKLNALEVSTKVQAEFDLRLKALPRG